MSLAHEKYLELQRLRNAAPITLEPQQTALLIIDMQAYFLHPESPLSRACDAQVPGVLHYFRNTGGRSPSRPCSACWRCSVLIGCRSSIPRWHQNSLTAGI